MDWRLLALDEQLAAVIGRLVAVKIGWPRRLLLGAPMANTRRRRMDAWHPWVDGPGFGVGRWRWSDRRRGLADRLLAFADAAVHRWR